MTLPNTSKEDIAIILYIEFFKKIPIYWISDHTFLNNTNYPRHNVMLLRILASISIFLLVTGLIYFTTLMLFGSFTLYSTASDAWVDNLTSVALLTSIILAAVLVSVSYFRKYSLTKLPYQPYANLAALILTAALTSQIEFGNESTSAELIEITVLPDEFIIEGRSGIDLIALLAEVESSGFSDGKQIVIFAPGEVPYERVQNTLQRLHEAGYSNVGLLSDPLETN